MGRELTDDLFGTLDWEANEYRRAHSWEVHVSPRYPDGELTLHIREARSKRRLTLMDGLDLEHVRQLVEVIGKFIRWKEGTDGKGR